MIKFESWNSFTFMNGCFWKRVVLSHTYSFWICSCLHQSLASRKPSPSSSQRCRCRSRLWCQWRMRNVLIKFYHYGIFYPKDYYILGLVLTLLQFILTRSSSQTSSSQLPYSSIPPAKIAIPFLFIMLNEWSFLGQGFS